MSKVNIPPEGKRKHKEDEEEKGKAILKTNKHKFTVSFPRSLHSACNYKVAQSVTFLVGTGFFIFLNTIQVLL